MNSTDDQINAYLANSLTDDERDAFEVRLLAEPELATECEAQQLLKDGLISEADSMVAVANPGVSGWWRPLAIAASALFALSLLFNLTSGNQPTGLAMSQEARFEITRGDSDAIANITANEPTLVRIDTYGWQESEMKVQLLRSDEPVATYTAQPFNNFLTLAFPGLEAGRYVVQVQAGEKSVKYQLQVSDSTSIR